MGMVSLGAQIAGTICHSPTTLSPKWPRYFIYWDNQFAYWVVYHWHAMWTRTCTRNVDPYNRPVNASLTVKVLINKRCPSRKASMRAQVSEEENVMISFNRHQQSLKWMAKMSFGGQKCTSTIYTTSITHIKVAKYFICYSACSLGKSLHQQTTYKVNLDVDMIKVNARHPNPIQELILYNFDCPLIMIINRFLFVCFQHTFLDNFKIFFGSSDWINFSKWNNKKRVNKKKNK